MTRIQIIKKKDVLTFVLFMLAAPVLAQNVNVNGNNFQKMVDFLPPAPNASAIIKHSAIGVGNTGGPNIGIPLFTVQGNKLSTAVSIGYSSTGIKVDEIASRVGMGWSLQAGGVVTRTIRGWDDENCTRLTPPSVIGNNCGTYNFCYNISSSGNGGPYDAEPDLYNFSMNGVSGSFVYDANMNPVVIPAQKFLIEKNLAGTVWNFKITTTDGIKYYFGGSTATEKTKRLSGCGRDYSTFKPSSWYLTKIEHPTGEVINFAYTPITYEYENGVNETQNWAWWQIDYNISDGGGNATIGCPSGNCPPADPSSRCVSKLQTQGVLLSSISNNFSSYNFSYTGRFDCNDKVVSSISMYNAGIYAGKFIFDIANYVANMAYQNESASGYSNTPYLMGLMQISSDNLVTLTHYFSYNDVGNRPPRLSFSQDHWGYFNGKVNTTFIPRPTDAGSRAHFPNAIANREVDPAFASKGMLNKIVYPTGGVDIIEYESNEWFHQQEYNTAHDYSCTVTGAGVANYSTVVSRSTDFTIDRAQQASLIFSCINNGNGTVFDHYNYSEVSVLNVLTNTMVYSYGIHTGETETVALGGGYLSPGMYRLTYTARGAVITTSVSLKYNTNTHDYANSNTIVGGVRVKRILTGNPSTTPMVKRYYYSEPETLNQSSLYHSFMPVYLKEYANTLECSIQIPPGMVGPYPALCHLEAMYSGSQNNIFDYQGSPVSYNSIIESEGEQFEGGAKQTKFYIGSDIPAQPVLGQLMLGAPMSNFSQLGNGRVYEETFFKKSPSGTLIPQKKIHNILINDSRGETELLGYAINQKRRVVGWTPDNSCPAGTPVSENITSCFDINLYHISSPWLHLESQTETVYDENGLNPVTSTRNFFYDNPQHLQLSRTETLNSKNQLIKEANSYPSDQGSTAPYNSMVTNNMLEPVVTTTTTIAGTPDIPVQQVAMDYGSAGGNNYEPVAVKKSVKGNALELEGTIDLYDVNGKILQFTGKDGIVSSIIWGYDYRYPVAKITGADYSAVINVLGVSLPALQGMTGSTLLAQLNNIRTALPTARVTSYTYNPGIGVTSITDADNKTNNYEYDGLGRLIIIKDQDNNIVKKNEYNIIASSPASTLNVFFNAERTSNVTCHNCASGYSGNTLVYTVPYGRYFSLISQLDADTQAAADAGGQEYANVNGSCINSIYATCTGQGYRVLNCTCELGTKQCENTVPDPNNPGSWNVYFHYLWSDGNISQTYNEYISNCTGIDKKMINCACQTGTRVCDGPPVNNGGGSYTLYYHYLFSDNTVSVPVTETITCSGIDKKIINCKCETATKYYYYSEYTTPSSNNGCPPGLWKCWYRYKWSDGSMSAESYTECIFKGCPLDAVE